MRTGNYAADRQESGTKVGDWHANIPRETAKGRRGRKLTAAMFVVVGLSAAGFTLQTVGLLHTLVAVWGVTTTTLGLVVGRFLWEDL